MKSFFLSFSLMVMAMSFLASDVMADGSTRVEKVCTTNQYGQTTCSEKTVKVTVHEPVPASVGDVPMGLVSVGLLFGAGAAYYASKRLSAS